MLGDMAGLIVPVHPEDGGEIGYGTGPGSVHACSVPPLQTGKKNTFLMDLCPHTFGHIMRT